MYQEKYLFHWEPIFSQVWSVLCSALACCFLLLHWSLMSWSSLDSIVSFVLIPSSVSQLIFVASLRCFANFSNRCSWCSQLEEMNDYLIREGSQMLSNCMHGHHLEGNLPFFDSINSDGESVFENLLRVWYHIGVRLSLSEWVVLIWVCIVLQLNKFLTRMSIIFQTGVLFASSLCLRLKLDYFAPWYVSIFL